MGLTISQKLLQEIYHKRTIRGISSINLKKKIVKSDCSVKNLEIKRSKVGVN